MSHETAYHASPRQHGTAGRRMGNGHDIGGPSAVIAGAAGFGLGLLAGFGRKAAVQAPTFAAGDWFDGLTAEHRAASALIDRLAETTENEPGRRAALLLQLQHAIGKHATEEEYVIYCVLAEHGQAVAATELNAEHAEVKQGLHALEMICKEQRPGFLERLAELRAAFDAHVRREEEEIFPRLHESLSPEQRKALTRRMNREGFKVA